MKHSVRRIIAYSFVAIFVVLAPILILYASGYRFRDQRFEKTGTLVVSTIPSNATITLNNAAVRQTTPATITALSPGEYAVNLSLTGYHPWTKRFAIPPDQAVFASDVRLFRNSEATLARSGTVKIISKSPSGDRALTTITENGREEFALFSPGSGVFTALSLPAPSDVENGTVEWSPLEDAFLYNTPTAHAAVWFNGTRRLDISALGTIQTAHFGIRATDPIIVSNSTHSGTLDWKTTPPRLTFGAAPEPPKTTVTDAWNSASGERVELWQSPNATSQLAVIHSTGKPTLHPLPTSRAYRLFETMNDNTVLLLDSEDTMTIWKLGDSSLLPLMSVDRLVEADINRGAQAIAYSTSFELWTYSASTGSRNLLTRLEQPISKVVAHPEHSHVFFIAGNTVSAIEQDDRDIRNRWTLATFDEPSGMIVSPDGKSLWVTTTGKTPGLYEILL